MKLPFDLKIYDKKSDLYIPNDYEYIKSIHFNSASEIDFIVTEFVNVTASGKPYMQEEKYIINDEIDIYINDEKVQNAPTAEERPIGRTASSR